MQYKYCWIFVALKAIFRHKHYNSDENSMTLFFPIIFIVTVDALCIMPHLVGMTHLRIGLITYRWGWKTVVWVLPHLNGRDRTDSQWQARSLCASRNLQSDLKLTLLLCGVALEG